MGKNLFYGSKPCCQHKGLVTVIAAAKIARLKKLGHGHLRHFFSIAKNSKLGLTAQYLFAT